MNESERGLVKAELDRLTAEFFRAVSFEEGSTPPYDVIHGLFIDAGLIIKNVGAKPEISTVSQFIAPRQASVSSGDLTRFNETELAETTEIFGNVAHRFNSYAKSGTLKGVPFAARGMISTQFILTPAGWKISAMAWDDEHPGLSILPQYEPNATADREFVHSRLIDARRERVFEAFRDPARLARWWGPNGFSSTFHEFDLRPGGAWRFVMHGPDGANYPNESVFVEVVAPDRIVLDHLSQPHHFRMTITFAAQGDQTRVGWRQVFDSAAERQRIAQFVTAANEQNLDRLAAEVLGLSSLPPR